MSGRKRVINVTCVIAIAIVLGVMAIKLHLSSNNKKAIQIAQEYLSQKYTQEMQYSSVRYSWIDPGTYHVSFVSADTGVDFEVEMWPRVFDLPEATTGHDDLYIWDNYLGSFFCRKTEEAMQSCVKTIWDENSNIQVILHSSNAYPPRSLSRPTEQMTAREMESLYNYEYFINTDRALNSKSKTVEAQRILEMFQSVKEQDYHPVEILIWYQTGEVKKGKKTKGYIWFGDGSDPYHIGRFENWVEITSIEDVEKIMDEQWFNK